MTFEKVVLIGVLAVVPHCTRKNVIKREILFADAKPNSDVKILKFASKGVTICGASAILSFHRLCEIANRYCIIEVQLEI